MSVYLILYPCQVVACDWSAPGLENEPRGWFCSFPLVVVLSLLLLTHLMCVRGTFGLFNNLWDPNNTIHVRKFSFGTCASVFACVETGYVGRGMTICIDVGQRPVGLCIQSC